MKTATALVITLVAILGSCAVASAAALGLPIYDNRDPAGPNAPGVFSTDFQTGVLVLDDGTFDPPSGLFVAERVSVGYYSRSATATPAELLISFWDKVDYDQPDPGSGELLPVHLKPITAHRLPFTAEPGIAAGGGFAGFGDTGWLTLPDAPLFEDPRWGVTVRFEPDTIDPIWREVPILTGSSDNRFGLDGDNDGIVDVYETWEWGAPHANLYLAIDGTPVAQIPEPAPWLLLAAVLGVLAMQRPWRTQASVCQPTPSTAPASRPQRAGDRRFVFAVVLSVLTCAVPAAAADVTVEPGTLTQAHFNAAGVNGRIVLARPGVYQLAARDTKPLAGQTIVGTTRFEVELYLDTTTVAGFAIPSARYRAVDESWIVAPANAYGLRVEFPGVTFRGVSFSGHAIWCEPPAGRTLDRLTIDRCRFVVPQPMGGDYSLAIYLNYSADATITDCIFDDPTGGKLDTFVFGWDAARLRVARCLFNGGGDGIHLSDFRGTTSGSIEQSLFVGQNRMPIELQGGGGRFDVLNCWQQDSVMVPTPIPHGQRKPLPVSSNDHNLGINCPRDRADLTTARGNVVLGPPRVPMGNGVFGQFTAFEFASRYECFDNLAIGVESPIEVTNSAASGTRGGNHFEGCTRGNVSSPETKARLLTRGRPGPLRDIVSGTPAPPSQPPPATQPGGWSLVVAPISTSAVRVNAIDLPAGTDRVDLAFTSTGGGEETLRLRVPVAWLDRPVYPLRPGWAYAAQATAIDAAGKPISTSTRTGEFRMPGAGTDPYPDPRQLATPATRPVITIRTAPPVFNVEPPGAADVRIEQGD